MEIILEDVLTGRNGLADMTIVPDSKKQTYSAE